MTELTYSRKGEILVNDLVLFGDREDVKIRHAAELGKPMPSEGGTINFVLRRCTAAVPGKYLQAEVHLNDKYKSWFHLVHHSDCDGQKIAKYLCSVSGHSEFTLENVWSRYDWCHYRNWGSSSCCSDKDSKDSDDDDANDDVEHDGNIYFAAVNEKGNGSSKLVLDKSCIQGDWNYGLRLVDKKDGKAYAYVYGDALVNEELGDHRCNTHPKTDFFKPMSDFLP